VWFSPCSLLVQELLVKKRDLKLSRVLKRLSRCVPVIIDDIGCVQQSREEMAVLSTLLAEWHEPGSVMLTSNLPFSKWARIFKDPLTTSAAIDRLVHHSVILALNLPSDRRKAVKRSKAVPSEESTGGLTGSPRGDRRRSATVGEGEPPVGRKRPPSVSLSPTDRAKPTEILFVAQREEYLSPKSQASSTQRVVKVTDSSETPTEDSWTYRHGRGNCSLAAANSVERSSRTAVGSRIPSDPHPLFRPVPSLRLREAGGLESPCAMSTSASPVVIHRIKTRRSPLWIGTA